MSETSGNEAIIPHTDTSDWYAWAWEASWWLSAAWSVAMTSIVWKELKATCTTPT